MLHMCDSGIFFKRLLSVFGVGLCGALAGPIEQPGTPFWSQKRVGLCAGAPLFFWLLSPDPRQAIRHAAEKLLRRGRLLDTPDRTPLSFLGAARNVESCKWGSRWSNSSINLYRLLDQDPSPTSPTPWRSLGGEGEANCLQGSCFAILTAVAPKQKVAF